MSFYKIPQNYAPGFVPQRYTFINDAAAATLTARLTDTRTAESVAELVLRDLWMPEIDVSAFLRRMAAALPFETGATGLYAPTTRTMTLSLAIGSDKAPDRIFLPATRETRSGEPLTSLPEVRLIGAEETDEVSVHCRTQCSALLTATCNGIPTQRTYGVAAEGVALFRLAAAEFPDAEAFDLHLTADGVESHFRYEVAETPAGSRRLAWLNEAGGIDRYTFPLTEERRYEIERRRLLLEESGYTQTEAVGEERLRIGSAYEPAAVLDALARLAARTDVVCFGALAQRSAASHATVVRFLDGVIRRERPTLRVFDVNLRQDFFSREVLEESMARCNILKISDEEAPRVAGCLTGWPAADPGGLCRELLDRRENLEMVILTEGAEGSRVFTRNRISAYVIPRGERVRPVDTVGAGDSFTAAFCAMLAAGYDIWPAQAFASKVAAFVCSCAGATPEYPAAAKTEFSGNL